MALGINAQLIENQQALSKDVGEIKGMVSGIKDSMESLDKSINGNGHPGLEKRTTNLENTFTSHCSNADDNFTEIKASLKTISANVAVLSESMKLHHADKQQHTIWGQLNPKTLWSILGMLFLFVVIVNIIIPKEIQLWGIVSKWLGL